MKKLTFLTLPLVIAFGCVNNGNSGYEEDMPRNSAPVSGKPHSGACRLVQGDAAGGGRKVVYRCNGNQVLHSPEARNVLAGMYASFGNGRGHASGYRTTRQAANRFSLGDEAACERAFINALAKFRATAEKSGYRSISDMHSFYNRIPQGGGTYDCEVGTFHSRVVFRARLH